MMSAVRISAAVDPWYNASYLEGLRATFGPKNLRFDGDGFPLIQRGTYEQGNDLAFVIENSRLKVLVDVQDAAELHPAGLDWCDIYAKVNYAPHLVPEPHARKVLPIGPTFPFRLCGPAHAFGRAALNFLRGRSLITSVKRHFAHWQSQYRYRLPEREYLPQPVEPGYIYFSSKIWYDNCDEYRRRFIEVCQSLDWLKFEGGFIGKWTVPGGHRDYVSKIQRSALVFNTPARLGGHGWKIVEFMALGKAIVTMPLERAMPVPLVHGEHVHVVEGSKESIREAVEHISQDDAYRQRLETNARAYYLAHLEPRRVIARILRFAQKKFCLAANVALLSANVFVSIATPAIWLPRSQGALPNRGQVLLRAHRSGRKSDDWRAGRFHYARANRLLRETCRTTQTGFSAMRSRTQRAGCLSDHFGPT